MNGTQQIDWRTASEHYFAIEGELKQTALYPAMRRRLGEVRGLRVLDFGGGNGHFAHELHELGASVVSVDKNAGCIARARATYGETDGLRFVHVDPPDYSRLEEEGEFDLVVISLVLVTISEANGNTAAAAAEAIRSVVRPGSRLVMGETHPFGRGNTFSTFSMSEVPYRGKVAPFEVEIRDGQDPELRAVFTDYHRPLEDVVGFVAQAGFHLNALDEVYDEVGADLHEAARRREFRDLPCFLVVSGMVPFAQVPDG